jgi:TolB protein
VGRASQHLARGLPVTAWLAAGTLLMASCTADSKSTEVTRSAEGEVPPIVFASDRAGTGDLWLMDPDGGRQTRLTTIKGDESSPEWSPDGSRVAFVGRPTGNDDVYVVDADGGNLRQLTATAACEDTPTWSRDGQQLVVASKVDCKDESSSLVLLNSNGKGEPKVVVKAPALWPDWSPDGQHLVYMAANSTGDDSVIVVSDPDGTNAQPLELPGINTPSEPSWAPDSHRIAFVSPTNTYDHENPADANEDLYLTDADSTRVERVTTTAGNDHWPPAWAPDGTTLIYTSDGTEAKQGDLMAVHLASRKITRLTDTATLEILADWRH